MKLIVTDGKEFSFRMIKVLCKDYLKMKPLEKKHLCIQILRQNNEDRKPSYHVPFL